MEQRIQSVNLFFHLDAHLNASGFKFHIYLNRVFLVVCLSNYKNFVNKHAHTGTYCLKIIVLLSKVEPKHESNCN